MKKIIGFAILILMQACSSQTNLIDGSSIKQIIITINDKEQKSEIIHQNKDSINILVEKLNANKREVIKFYPTHTLKLIYNNGTEDVVICNGLSMKYKGLTYKLKESIRSIVR